MSTLEEDRDTGAGPAESERVAGALAWRSWRRRWRAGAGSLLALLRRHWLFAVALALGVVPRAIVMAAYAPAALFKLDTYDYLWGATHLTPNPVNPAGYSAFLWLLRPFHSLLLIAALQHLMGLGIAVMIYAILRYWGVSAWLATLATTPVLFDPAQLLLEQLIMADILAMFLMIASFTVLLTRRSPSGWRSATALLLMGASTVVRPDALPIIFLMAGYLLVRRSGWRRAGAALAAGLLPVAGYVAWFAAASGTIGLTRSDGLFLWSRTMSFASCATIKPPPSLTALCPAGSRSRGSSPRWTAGSCRGSTSGTIAPGNGSRRRPGWCPTRPRSRRPRMPARGTSRSWPSRLSHSRTRGSWGRAS